MNEYEASSGMFLSRYLYEKTPFFGIHDEQDQSSCICDALFSVNRALVISGGAGHVVCVWDSNEKTVKYRIFKHKNEIYAVYVSLQFRVVASGAGDNKEVFLEFEL